MIGDQFIKQEAAEWSVNESQMRSLTQYEVYVGRASSLHNGSPLLTEFIGSCSASDTRRYQDLLEHGVRIAEVANHYGAVTGRSTRLRTDGLDMRYSVIVSPRYRK